MRHVKYSGRVMYSLSVGKMELTDSVMSSTMIWYCFLQLGRTTKLYCLRWFIIFHYMLFEMSLPNSTTILVLLRHNQVLLLPFLECKKKHCLYLSRMLDLKVIKSINVQLCSNLLSQSCLYSSDCLNLVKEYYWARHAVCIHQAFRETQVLLHLFPLPWVVELLG